MQWVMFCELIDFLLLLLLLHFHQPKVIPEPPSQFSFLATELQVQPFQLLFQLRDLHLGNAHSCKLVAAAAATATIRVAIQCQPATDIAAFFSVRFIQIQVSNRHSR